jgi:hypothetical protein
MSRCLPSIPSSSSPGMKNLDGQMTGRMTGRMDDTRPVCVCIYEYPLVSVSYVEINYVIHLGMFSRPRE